MKKTIGALAVLATMSSANALIGPGHRPVNKACISVSKDQQGAQYAGTCDESRNNEELNKKLYKNGCAEGQASFVSYTVKLPLCMPPNVVQL